MRDVLISSVKRVKKFFLAAILLLAINLAANGDWQLIGAVFIGAMLSGFYIASSAARLQSIMSLDQSTAKRRMLVGLAFRLLMLFVVLNVAVHISPRIFFTVAASFMIFYAIALLGLIITSYNQNFFDEDDGGK